ncbi:MAG: carbon-nitrogen hydrolase family protein [Microbacterium sp.]|jgi:predicted amidohydrolase|nr:carbon-nitrogen hydrolase family protein [Microbacterium sp.]
MTGTTVAVAQFAPGAEDNLPSIARLVEDAAGRGARLVVLPEYAAWFETPFTDALIAHAESLDGPFTRELARLADRFGVWIVAGLVERAEGTRVHNTVVAVDAGGVQASYRKQHLYDAFGDRESDRIAAGALDAPQTFQLDDLTFGLMTCYDLRFPESARVLLDAGADAIVVPAEWVRGPLKEDHWSTLIRARAIENTAFVVAADQTPPIGVGRSMIVDPSGIVLASLGTQPGVAIATLDRSELERVRQLNPALELRRYRVEPRDESAG